MKAAKSFLITLAVVLVLGALVLAGSHLIKGRAGSSTETSAASEDISKDAPSERKKANPIVKAVVTEAMDTYMDSADGQAKEIADSMTAEDKDTVAEIIASNVSLDSISDVKDILAGGDQQDLIDYAQENLPKQDQEELLEILSKYAEP